MKINRFINKIFPQEVRVGLISGGLIFGCLLTILIIIFSILGIVAKYLGWFSTAPSLLDRGGMMFLAIIVTFILWGWIYFAFLGSRKLIKYLIKTWKES